MPQIAMLTFPGVQALDISGPLDVFSEANNLLSEPERYRATILGPAMVPLQASNGITILPDMAYGEAYGPFDLFLVAGGPHLPTAGPDPDMVACIRRLSANSTLFGSICTGAFALGHAGLLDGKRVTTHWQNAAQLAALFPAAKVDFDKIFLRDGPLVTSAGVTAGIDLALALVREAHGGTAAVAVAKRLVVVAQRQGGQSQFSPFAEVSEPSDSPIFSSTRHVMEHLKSRLSVSDLAAVAAMSERSFARLFVQATGMPPAEFVERARLDAARNLLEGGALHLKVIAHESGFGTPKRMHSVFVKRLGVSPLQYRTSFGQTGAGTQLSHGEFKIRSTKSTRL